MGHRAGVLRKWEQVVNSYDPQEVTEIQFITDFCKTFGWNRGVQYQLSEGLSSALPNYHGFDDEDVKSHHCFEVRTSAGRRLPQRDVGTLLCSVELISFRKGEKAMLQYLAQQKHIDIEECEPSLPAEHRQSFLRQAEETMRASDAWYQLSLTGFERFYGHVCERLREIVMHAAKEQFSTSTLGQQDGNTQNNTQIHSLAGDVCSNQAGLDSSRRTVEGNASPESEKIATTVTRKLLEDHGIDLSVHRKWLCSEMARMLYEIKAYYENDVRDVAMAGHLPTCTPAPKDQEKTLEGLASLIRHVYTNEEGKLGEHHAFVKMMFRKIYGSILLTGKKNVFDDRLGSAFELVDMVLGLVIPLRPYIKLPLKRTTKTIGDEPLFENYRNLCLTSRRTRELVQNVLMKRSTLITDFTNQNIDEAITTVLKKKTPLRVVLRNNIRETNHLALIPYLHLLLDTTTRQKVKEHLPYLLNMMTGLAKVEIFMSGYLQNIAFTERGKPASWLLNTIAMIPKNVTLEIGLENVTIGEVDHDTDSDTYDSDDTESDYSDDAELKKSSTPPPPDYRSSVIHAFRQISGLLIRGDPSTQHLTDRGSVEKESRRDRTIHTKKKVNAERFYQMMSQWLREQGKDSVADWFEAEHSYLHYESLEDTDDE